MHAWTRESPFTTRTPLGPIDNRDTQKLRGRLECTNAFLHMPGVAFRNPASPVEPEAHGEMSGAQPTGSAAGAQQPAHDVCCVPSPVDEQARMHSAMALGLPATLAARQVTWPNDVAAGDDEWAVATNAATSLAQAIRVLSAQGQARQSVGGARPAGGSTSSARGSVGAAGNTTGNMQPEAQDAAAGSAPAASSAPRFACLWPRAVWRPLPALTIARLLDNKDDFALVLEWEDLVGIAAEVVDSGSEEPDQQQRRAGDDSGASSASESDASADSSAAGHAAAAPGSAAANVASGDEATADAPAGDAGREGRYYCLEVRCTTGCLPHGASPLDRRHVVGNPLSEFGGVQWAECVQVARMEEETAMHFVRMEQQPGPPAPPATLYFRERVGKRAATAHVVRRFVRRLFHTCPPGAHCEALRRLLLLTRTAQAVGTSSFIKRSGARALLRHRSGRACVHCGSGAP